MTKARVISPMLDPKTLEQLGIAMDARAGPVWEAQRESLARHWRGVFRR
jgi:hypothetical protein